MRRYLHFLRETDNAANIRLQPTRWTALSFWRVATVRPELFLRLSEGKQMRSSILTIAAILALASSAQRQTPKRVSVNGTTLTYVDEGTGSVVVFVHGAYSDHRVWELQREVVSKGYRYVALDLRYFGTAPWSDNGKNFNVATHAADVAAFIRALNVGPVHLVGRSYGAITSLAVSIRHPKLVRGLFLNEPGIASAVTNAEEQKLLREDRKCIGPAAAATKAGNHAEAVKLFFECTHNQAGAFDSLPPARRDMLLDNARTVALQVDPAAAPRITATRRGQGAGRNNEGRADTPLLSNYRRRCAPLHPGFAHEHH
jgi:pimeloyl-ACP methyl ester carboxylesterase